MTEQIKCTYTVSSIIKRITALVIDSFVIIYTFAAIVLLSIGLEFIDEETLNESNSFLVLRIIALILYIAKDSFKGISFGKWIMGIMIRDDNEQKLVPSFWILFIRNLYLVLWPIELVVLIFNKNKKRLGDKYANTIVLNNPDTKKKTYRIIIFISTLIFISGFIALLGHLKK